MLNKMISGFRWNRTHFTNLWLLLVICIYIYIYSGPILVFSKIVFFSFGFETTFFSSPFFVRNFFFLVLLIFQCFFCRTSREASQFWSLPIMFCRSHNMTLTPAFLIDCAKADKWLAFICHAQSAQFPKNQVMLRTNKLYLVLFFRLSG